MTLILEAITVDAVNPRKLAEFWAEALHWNIAGEVDGVEVWIKPQSGDHIHEFAPEILFLKNTEVRQVKNRLHFDLRPDDQNQEVARLEKLGANRIDIGQYDYPDCTWVVMADPEGNEFCILTDVQGARD